MRDIFTKSHIEEIGFVCENYKSNIRRSTLNFYQSIFKSV
jgi:hypothetical protein